MTSILSNNISEGAYRGECVLPTDIKISGVQLSVSAPGKIILHGEHSVVYGKLALAASLGLRTKLRIVEINAPNVIILELFPLKFIFTYDLQKIKEFLFDQPLPTTLNASEFNWENPENVDHTLLLTKAERFVGSTIKDTSLSAKERLSVTSFFYLLGGILGSVDIDLQSFCLSVDTELSMGAGTGSSASFSVTVAAGLIHFIKTKTALGRNVSRSAYKPHSWDEMDLKEFSQRELDAICKWAFCAEKIIHGTPSGVDNTVCTYGSMVEFRKGVNPTLVKLPFNFNILLINTRVPRETGALISKVAKLYETYPDLVSNILNGMEDVAFLALSRISEIAKNLGTPIVERHFEELGRLSAINHNFLSSLGVSHIKLDEIMLILAEYGLQGKLTGAGGGGYAICLVPPYYDPKDVIRKLQEREFDVMLTHLGGVGVTVDSSFI